MKIEESTQLTVWRRFRDFQRAGWHLDQVFGALHGALHSVTDQKWSKSEIFRVAKMTSQ